MAKQSIEVRGSVGAVERQDWDGDVGTFTARDAQGRVVSTRPLTSDEAAVLAVADAANTASTNRDTLQSRARAALTANTAFLAVASPSNAQIAAQVTALTKECSALIRLLLGQLDSTAGT